MLHYILRRLALMPLTVIGVSFVIFALTRLMPGGPVEQMLQRNLAGSSQGKSAAGATQSASISEQELERLERQFGLDKNIFQAYCQWLGLWPVEYDFSQYELSADGNSRLEIIIDGQNYSIEADAKRVLAMNPPAPQGYIFNIQSPLQRATNALQRGNKTVEPMQAEQLAANYLPRLQIYKSKFAGVLQGQFGLSFKYNQPVLQMMLERMPISLYYGLLAAFITWVVSLPLGIIKAVWHNSIFDNISSLLIFAGYAVPGFALGALLVVFVAARLEWFPLGGFCSSDFASLSWPKQLLDLMWHAVLPMCCYCIGSFAATTMLMKNSLLETLGADYMRTAIAKGLSFRKALLGHALRNALLPLGPGLGGLLSVLVSGSMLIERVFDISGFGLLNYQAIVDKDYSLIMGILFISSLLMVLGNLLGDLIAAKLDPRVSYH